MHERLDFCLLFLDKVLYIHNLNDNAIHVSNDEQLKSYEREKKMVTQQYGYTNKHKFMLNYCTNNTELMVI